MSLCPKCAPKYRKLSRRINIHQNREGLEKAVATGEIPYFLRVRCERGFLHTVEVRGSNPLSPTIFFFPDHFLKKFAYVILLH
jgi:hypothetical protein